MRKFGLALAVTAMVCGSLTSAQTAFAAQSTLDTTVYTSPSDDGVHLLDCFGTTGGMGCGPGWTWRDGWRGWACYPC